MVQHRIVLTGGGTGGHVYPAISVHEQLKNDPSVEAILYIGVRGHLEERLCQERQIEFHGLSISGLPRKLSPALISWPFKTMTAVREARKILKLFRPTVVLGTGGYAAAPPLAAALLDKIPYAIHEPDAHPGLVNKLFAKNSSLCSLGMEGALSVLKSDTGRVVVNGNPVGQAFVAPRSRDAACAVVGLRHDLQTVLITGGSQGAQAINEAVLAALPQLLDIEPHIQIVHQAGDKNLADLKERVDQSLLQNPRYHLRAYFDDMALAYAICDLTVCRAGAMTISELAVTGTPAIFVPYPFAAQNHQMHNAQFVESKGGAIVLPQGQLTPESLAQLIKQLLLDGDRLKGMRQAMQSLGKPDAAVDLANQIKELSEAYQQQRKAS